MNDIQTSISKAYTTLNNLKDNNVLNISKVEWWLLKYSNFYKETYNFFYSQYLFTLEDGTTVRLPPSLESTDEEIFFSLFKNLENISEIHKMEDYFQKEMVKYHKVKHSHSNLKNWAQKNEDLGAKKYSGFIIDYLENNEDDKFEDLKICMWDSKELEDIYINRQDFKYTIEFLNIFDELYWIQKILPESIEKYNLEVEKIPFDDTYWDRMSEDFDAKNLI